MIPKLAITSEMLHFFEGQYSWSMIMGFETLIIEISSNVKSAALLALAPGQVFTLMPLSVPLTVQFLTVIPLTSFSFGYLPRLPILPAGHINIIIHFTRRFYLGFLCY